MQLFTFGYSQEKNVEFPHMGRRYWRWSFDISWFELSLNQEYKSDIRPEWSEAVKYYCFSIRKYYAWGSSHVYYDCPHCMLSLGFIHFNWSGWRGDCKKCMSD